MKVNNKYQELMAPWKSNQTVRQSLIKRIKQTALLGTNRESLFTEQKIAEEYYKSWLQLPSTALLQRIAQHPLLTKKQREIIDQQLADQKVSQIKWSAGGTAVTMIIYSAFLSRAPTFRNFFNRENSWLATRFLKKSVGVYVVFLAWVASLTSTYEKSMPNELQNKGLLKQLGLLGKPSNN